MMWSSSLSQSALAVARNVMWVGVRSLFLCALAGAVVGLAHAQPGTVPANALPTQASGSEGASSTRLSWTLDRLVDEAVQVNPGVMARQAEVASAQAGIESARWQYFPTPAVRGERFEDRQMAVISLRQPLWTGGRLGADLSLAQARHAVAERAVTEVRLDIAQRVASAWSNLLAASGRRQAYATGLDRLGEMESMMRRRMATGLSGEVDLDLVRARVEQAKGDLAQAAADERAAAESLSQLVGLSLRAGSLADINDAGDVLSTLSTSEFVEQGLSVNPALKRLAAEVEVADSRAEQAQVSAWPTLYARSEYQQGAITGSLPEGTRFYIGLEQTLGAGLSYMSGVRAAEAARESAREAREAARRDLSARIVADIEAYRAARDYLRGAAGNLGAMERVSESYQRMFLAGKRSWLEVLNMVREQTEAARQVSTARVQLAHAAYRLRLHRGEFVWLQ